MISRISRFYDRLILSRPGVTLLVVLGVLVFFAFRIPDFKLDASGDSLVLENDHDLRYFRQINDRYGASDVLILTYTPTGNLFAPESLAALKSLRDELREVHGIESVTSILDVPLLFTSKVGLSDLGEPGRIKTLEDSGIDLAVAEDELLTNPLYARRLLSQDGRTTTILMALPTDQTYKTLLKRRYELREKGYDGTITREESFELAVVSARYRERLALLTDNQNRLVDDIRQVARLHQGEAEIFLGGVPMIVADMISFIRNDLGIFGVGVFLFLILTLLVIFRRIRWVFLSMGCCLVAGLIMIGYLGMVDWRVTVISSNFISLMLIFTMSLTIHLIVRYRELHGRQPDDDQRTLVRETVRLTFLPCLYTTLTTIVAFVSLLVSGIRPVMDFGMMMTVGLIVSFVLSFILFPAGLMLFPRMDGKTESQGDSPLTLFFARLTEHHGGKVVLVCIGLAVGSGFGMTKLKVENRFIDYFRSRTEIYQGMSVIDQKLGGTTPLELILDFHEEPLTSTPEDDPFDDPFAAGEAKEPPPWYVSAYRMEQIEKVHDFLTGISEIGEVLSIATVTKIVTRLNGDVPLENYELAIMHQESPQQIRELLITPYIATDIPQARITMRVIESGQTMGRKALLDTIRTFIREEIGLDDDQIHFTGMFVLYNNMLQSLFRSQIMTISMVFLGIMVMFVVLFRSFMLAVIAIIPNLLPAAMVLGAMGWFGIPLDMMTITIAAITIGIAVDDTIHYVHRFQKEFPKDRNYLATMYRCHVSIGRAMYYTSVTIIIGFSILVLSNFIPTIYFGLFTGFAMFVALLAALILLPKLLLIIKPLGPNQALSNTNE
ncbi:MAG: MMPL family transporter [Proteobacteria bacterium]|nr:MMPL family transporter [Pseudomonadota bacterium]MBU1688927.1 MMPL family transporter [Pseudomonadota bacterium]